MADRIEARTFDEAQLRQFIKVLGGGRQEGRTGRFAALHRMVRQRDQHFYGTKEADQQLPPPHDDVEPYQSDLLRQNWVELKARMVETPYAFRVEAPREGLSKQANDFEKVLQRGFELLEEREDVALQGDLADGQILHCFGMLHWQRGASAWPGFPDAEEAEDLDLMDETERKRFRDRTEEDGEGKRFVEKEESRLDRDKHAKAKAGFPYYVEVVRPDMVAFVPDRSLANGFGAVLTVRSTPLIEYDKKLREAGQRVGLVSLNQYKKSVRIYEERGMPARYDPSTDPEAWGKELLVAQFWTRDEGYELVCEADASGGSASDFNLVKSWPHAFGMPPFAMARAFYTNHPDPALAYQPALEGGYRLKPFVDRAMTLYMAIAQQIALPFYYIKLDDGSYMLEDGKPVMLTRNALSAQTLPPGAEIVTIAPQVNPAMVESLKMQVEELREALPDTGFVEVGASTQPWTIRLAQDQANTIVKWLKQQQARALQTAARSVTRDMQELGEPVWVYGKTKDGKVAKDKAIGVDPKDIPSLEVHVDIDPFSTAQAVANIEHLRTLLDDPLVPFTPKDFLEQALRSATPEEDLEEWQAWTIWDGRIKVGSTEQELARRFGDKFIVTPAGQFVGMGGDAVDPMAVLSANGFSAQSPGVAGDIQAEQNPVLPALPAARTPGTMPVAGQPL